MYMSIFTWQMPVIYVCVLNVKKIIFTWQMPVYIIIRCQNKFLIPHIPSFLFPHQLSSGAQWLSGRVLDSRPKGSGFEPHRRHCVVVLEQDTFILA